MKSLAILISVWGCFFYFLCAPTRGQSVVPDVTFYNGTLLTMEKDQQEAEAIAVQGDTILGRKQRGNSDSEHAGDTSD